MHHDVLINYDYSKENLIDVAENYPEQFYCINDLSSRCVAASRFAANLFGYTLPELIATPIKAENFRCKAADLADIYVEEDQSIIQQTKPIKSLCRLQYANDQWTWLYGSKRPLKNRIGHVVGVEYRYVDLAKQPFVNMHAILNQSDDHVRRGAQCIFYVESENYDYQLSPKQSECIYYLIRGYSASEIGGIMNLSRRTIESYIDTIKYKMNCRCKRELISKAIDEGFLSKIPEAVLKKFRV